MNNHQSSSFAKLIVGTIAAFAFAITMISPALADDKLPEVSSDGLHLVKGSKLRVVYMKPGVNLEKYTEVKILDCYVQFTKNYERDYNMNELGLDGRVTTKQMDDIKARLSKEFNIIFTQVLDKNDHPVVDNVGPNVLLLRPAIINLMVQDPNSMESFGRTYVNSAGDMTLYMELYDSATSELIGRVIDPEAGQQGDIAMIASRVLNKSEADQILRRWAQLLSDHLGDMTTAAASSS